jgi:site-specific recombinase XerD
MREESFIRQLRPAIPALPSATFCVPPPADLRTALEDFYLSRRALRLSPATLEHYRYTAGEFVTWLESQGVSSLSDVRALHVRAWLAAVSERGVKDTTLHAKARGVKTLLRFWHSEGYIPQAIVFAMPKLEKKRLPFLGAEKFRAVFKACSTPRDRALLLVFADSGVRRAEAVALNWEDVDFATGSLLVRRGKGGKARMSAIGARSRRAILGYRRTLPAPPQPSAPLWQTRDGMRLTQRGVQALFARLSKRAGLKATPHALRHTFALMSLRQGMDLITISRLMGHATTGMTSHYLMLEDSDLLRSHQAHGLDSWL